jgi:ATP-binding cassette subfamily A (ABC1) protein 3
LIAYYSFAFTANSAATAAGVIFFLSYFPYQFLQPRYDTLSKGTKLMSCLLSNTALSFGCQIISMFEGTGAGVQWDNIRSTVSPDDNFTMSDVMIMMLFDGFLYLFLAIYIEGVWPGEYGMRHSITSFKPTIFLIVKSVKLIIFAGLPMPWYFPFTVRKYSM